jgi:hypothetical protein
MSYRTWEFIPVIILGGFVWWDTKSVTVAFSVAVGCALLIDIIIELRRIHKTLEVIAHDKP